MRAATHIASRNCLLLKPPSVSAGRRISSATACAGFADVFKTLGLSTEEREGKNDQILNFARNAAMGCELAPKEAPEGLQLGTFAGGCFWGLELQFQRVPGVVKTSVGYTGGSLQSPTYEAVCSGRTGHTEAVQVTYDPNQTTFEKLLEAFADKTDLTQKNRQGNDIGTQYRSGVYYHNEEQKQVAEQYFEKLSKETGMRGWRGAKIEAELLPVGDYWLAEGYHQQYLAKGGRFGMPQSAEKNCKDEIRCYG